MQLLQREAERRLVPAGAQRTLCEKRTEALRGAFDRAKLRVQAIHERR